MTQGSKLVTTNWTNQKSPALTRLWRIWERWRQLCINTNVMKIAKILPFLHIFFLEKEWRSLGGFPNSASVFPRVKPAMQVILLWDQGELEGGRSGVWFYFLLLHITLCMHDQYFSYLLECNLQFCAKASFSLLLILFVWDQQLHLFIPFQRQRGAANKIFHSSLEVLCQTNILKSCGAQLSRQSSFILCVA